jgi:TolA-binding protein
LAAEALLWAGVCEEKLNHPANAAALYGRSLRMGGSKHTRALAHYGIARSEMSLMDVEAAGRALGAVIEEAPPESLAEQAYFWRGRFDYAAGLWASAQENLLKLASMSPPSPLADDALFFAARAARNSSDFPRAIEMFQELGKRFPQSPLLEQADIEAAQCMIEAGRAEEAARKFEDFIKNNVGSLLRPMALYDMGRALQRAGKFEQAIEQYRAAEGGERTELAARARFAIAECLTELDRGPEAIAELTSITRGGYLAGWAERAQLQMARLLERNGQKEEARHIYLAVSGTYKDDAAGIVAQRALTRLDSERTPALIR